MRVFLLLMLIGSARAGSILGPLEPTAIDEAREQRIRSEVKGVKAALLAKRGSEGDGEGGETGSEVRGEGGDKGSKVHDTFTSPPLATQDMTALPHATLNTHGITIEDQNPPLDLDIDSYRLLLEIGGVGLDISTVEVNMDNVLEDRLTAHFKAIMGSVIESVAVTLNFLEDSVHQSGEGETTGEVEIETKMHLHANNPSSLVGLDEAYATKVLEDYFVGDSLQGLLDAMKQTGTELSFIRLQSNSTNDSDAFTASTVPVSLAAAFGGVLVLVVGFGIMTGRSRSLKNDSESQGIDATESEEDQFHPLAPVHPPVQSLSNFRSATNPFDDVYSDDDEDSLGSDRYLNWPIEREVRSRWRKSSLHDVSVDSDDESLGRIKR